MGELRIVLGETESIANTQEREAKEAREGLEEAKKMASELDLEILKLKKLREDGKKNEAKLKDAFSKAIRIW